MLSVKYTCMSFYLLITRYAFSMDSGTMKSAVMLKLYHCPVSVVRTFSLPLLESDVNTKVSVTNKGLLSRESYVSVITRVSPSILSILNLPCELFT